MAGYIGLAPRDTYEMKKKIILYICEVIMKDIKELRKEKNMTSAKLAELVDLSHDFIRQIESEKTAYNFSVDTFYKISVALEVSLDKLIQKDDDQDIS